MHSKNYDTLIIVPVFNEAKNIEFVLEDITKNYPYADILVVNDGSDDNIEDVLKHKTVTVLNHAFNMGIGASFQTGCQFALSYGYDYIVRIDGDGQHAASCIQGVLVSIKENKADIVIGSRFLEKHRFASSLFRVTGISIISLLLFAITGRKVTDPTSGFCAMNKKAFSFFAINTPADYPEPEILMYHYKFQIKEVPIKTSKRRSGASSITPLLSIYYMYKVLLSLLMRSFRKEET